MTDAREIQRAIERIRNDKRSGAGELAVMAARTLLMAADMDKPRNAEGYIKGLGDIAARLIAAQPSMAPILNLVNDVLIAAEGLSDPAAVRRDVASRAKGFLSTITERSKAIRSYTAEVLKGRGATPVNVLTHSYSSTVVDAVTEAHRASLVSSVVCTESRPGFEGRKTLARLRECGVPVTYVVDMGVFSIIQSGGVDDVLIGGDCVSRKGLVNKTGTLGIALAASESGVAVYALLSTDKFLHEGLESFHSIELQDLGEVLDTDDEGVSVINNYFDTTPLRLLTGIITEKGIRCPEEAEKYFNEGQTSSFLRELAASR